MHDNKSAFASYEYDVKIKQTFPYYDDFFEQITDLVKTVFDHPVSWLDVGCGTGKMGEVAHRNVELERFVFSDASEGMMSVAKKNHSCPQDEFLVCDVLDLPYKDEFNVITAVQVFHFFHVQDRQKALKRCYEALKEDGLLITFENFAPFTKIGQTIDLKKWKEFQMRQGKTLEEANQHIDRYGKAYFPVTIEEHLKLMRECGFKVVEILWVSNMQVGLWGLK
ncbi:MAG: class I SAM-dependent methyltransferase [Erysipelotrichaceae bacterium]|nr:class I SAM-dependent methyltransferase [Erysipelotrichaceae bacterium]